MFTLLHVAACRRRQGSGNDDLLKAVNEAYAVIGDPLKRRSYDLSHGMAGVRYGPASSWTDAQYSQHASAAARSAGVGAAGSASRSSNDGGIGGGDGKAFDWREWNRMHFGPTEEDRAQFYDQVRAGGFKGPWEDPTLSDRTNYFSRRKVEQWTTASRGLSETQHYREYADRWGVHNG